MVCEMSMYGINKLPVGCALELGVSFNIPDPCGCVDNKKEGLSSFRMQCSSNVSELGSPMERR